MKSNSTPTPSLLYFVVVPVLFLAFHASAQEDKASTQADTITPAQLQTVLGYLQSTDQNRRHSAYQACRKRGEDFRETYIKLIEAAIKHHTVEFKKVIELGPSAPQRKRQEAWETWKNDAATALKEIQTDHSKKKDKLDEIDRLFATAAKSWKALQQTSSRKPRGEDPMIAKLKTHGAALHELTHQLKNPDEDPPSESIDLMAIEREHNLGTSLKEYLSFHQAAVSFFDNHQKANEANEKMTWASKDQKTFAAILNERRATVGLDPLTLNEKLSDACAAHGAEMERLKYFAHESPVAENREPSMRAKKAGFSGQFAGECIFMGRTEPVEAERAWWYSCGHRLINYSSGDGVSILGIARHNQHWVLMTGR